MAKKINIKIALNSVQVLEFFYRNPENIIPDFKPDRNHFNSKVKSHYRCDLEKNLFGVVLDFIYVTKDKNKIELFKLSFITEFIVDNLKDIITVRPNNYFDMDDERLESTLVGIAISTGRGIIFEKSTGTIFNEFILPLINPKELILSKKLKETK